MGVVVRANTFKTKMMKQSKGPSKGISQAEMLGFVAHKIDICVSIFSLLGSICKDNPENELYTFNLVFHIVQYVRYIP
jgi:inositol 1,4,5-triphosphate receptor type 1/inositol 1,4,5-triphosphate receptor type 3